LRVGVTGHQSLKNPSQWEWVTEEIRRALQNKPLPLVGITALAAGADQIFADIILEMRGELYVVLPFASYEETFSSDTARQRYFRLLSNAMHVETLARASSDEQSFLLAGFRVVELAETMIAVWDGKKAEGLGGTADVVAQARIKKVPIVHINPIASCVKSI
jgi:hypothetical protein